MLESIWNIIIVIKSLLDFGFFTDKLTEGKVSFLLSDSLIRSGSCFKFRESTATLLLWLVSFILSCNDKDILELDHIFSNEKCYALKVQGDSMIEAGINNGDWVIVEKQNSFLLNI